MQNETTDCQMNTINEGKITVMNIFYFITYLTDILITQKLNRSEPPSVWDGLPL